MDVFIEKMVTKKKDIYDYLTNIGIIIAGFMALLVSIQIRSLRAILPLLFPGICYGMYYLIKSRNIEFEYIVTNDELDIDKIVARKKRKRIFTASCKLFEILAKEESEHFTNDIKKINNVIKCVSSNNSSNVYFAVLNYKNQKTVLFFEPDERMLNSFKTYIPKKIHT